MCLIQAAAYRRFKVFELAVVLGAKIFFLTNIHNMENKVQIQKNTTVYICLISRITVSSKTVRPFQSHSFLDKYDRYK